MGEWWLLLLKPVLYFLAYFTPFSFVQATHSQVFITRVKARFPAFLHMEKKLIRQDCDCLSVCLSFFLSINHLSIYEWIWKCLFIKAEILILILKSLFVIVTLLILSGAWTRNTRVSANFYSCHKYSQV